MKEKIFAVLITTFLVLSIFSMAYVPTVSSGVELPDYEAVDWQSGLAGELDFPTIEESVAMGASLTTVESFNSTPPVNTTVWDWFLWAHTRGEAPTMTLRVCVGNVEIWVQDYLLFPEGDPRNEDPYNLAITDEMCQYLADEFNNVIYPTDTTYFGAPEDRDGTNTIFELLGWPSFTWYWIATDNPQRVILKVLNYRDTNYYDPTYPYYVAGFYSSTYTRVYYKRNMIHIDAWRWWQRLGPAGTQWFPERPDLINNRPYLYEAVTAHEYQHNIHRDWNPDSPSFMNEGCSMFAEILCGYGVSWSHVNSYLYTPDNSLTVWGDQGGINILADYGAATLWVIYLSDHYGGPAILSRYVQAGIPGVEGVDAALEYFGYTERFDDVYRDWRIANLIHSDYPGKGRYNYTTLNLGGPEAIPIFTHEISGLPIPPTKGTDFGNTFTILGYDTGVSKIGPYGSDYIVLNQWDKMGIIYFDGDDTAVYGWTMTEEGYWWSGAENLMNTLLYGEAYVDPADPTLVLTTYWNIEDYWDFGFVQVSTDGGATWTSLENEYTTYDHDPDAHPDIVANLPGLTGWSKDWITMTFDLADYAGETVLIGFRYMTDWAVLYEGWYISEAKVSGISIFDLLAPIYPEADFKVTLVYAFVIDGYTFYYPADMWLNDETEKGLMLQPFKKPHYAILIVSSIGEKGFVDYTFSAKPLRGRMMRTLAKVNQFE